MTTYFTPVGDLAEETRATGAAINAREAAVTSGFTALEAVLAVTDGTASITYGTNWANYSSRTSLKKTLGSLVILNLALSASGSPSGPVITLPAGYRPALRSDGQPCEILRGGLYYPGHVYILTDGTVNASINISGTLGLLLTSDVLFTTAVFFTS